MIRQLWWRIYAAAFPKRSLPRPCFRASSKAPRVAADAWWEGDSSPRAQRLADRILEPRTLRNALSALEGLPPEPHLVEGMRRIRRALAPGGSAYADICTVLCGAADLLRPASYLEVGVRRGRSAAMVAGRAPACEIWGFDEWQTRYAGADNPGPDYVRRVLRDAGHAGAVHLVSGDSHQTLPRFFREHPNCWFDLITVDGDHSRWGAARDLSDVLPRLKIGGVIVFDDICHPAHRFLAGVWRDVVGKAGRFETWEYDRDGYGVAFGVRRY